MFWIPLFQILEDRGFRVCLVNARHVKNVPGRKTDVSDCQWLQYLHSVGLLRASHRPAQTICAVRSIWRHRESLVQMAAAHIQHMQKALDQMNLQLHHVISDISGTTGLSIIDAILDGERNPETLAALRDPRIVASRETIARALVGEPTASINNGLLLVTSRSSDNCEFFPTILPTTRSLCPSPKTITNPGAMNQVSICARNCIASSALT